MKRRLLKVLFSLALGVGLLEGLCSGLAWVKYGTLDVGRLNDADQGNSFVTDELNDYQKSIVPHPFLGWVKADGNNVGTYGRDFPLRHDPSKFTVLVTGGSFAFQLCKFGDLEAQLNSIDISEKPVIVLNGANGAYRQPQQTIATAIYGEIADAVVCIDGFNEHWQVSGGTDRLEVVCNNFSRLNPVLSNGPGALLASAGSAKLRSISRDHNSRALFFLTKVLRSRIVAAVPQQSTKIDEIFALPEDWTIAERQAFNLEQYKKYSRLAHAITAQFGVKEAHFIQPCRDTSPEYRKMTADMLELNAEGIHVGSLLDCLSGMDGIWADPCHCASDGPGYHIACSRITDELARLWNSPVMSPERVYRVADLSGECSILLPAQGWGEARQGAGRGLIA